MPTKANFGQWDTQIFTAADALKTRPPKQYAANPFFALPSLSVVYGISGSHKTNLMVDLAVCLAANRRWLEGVDAQVEKGFEVSQGAVLWIDQDSGNDALHERFGAMLRAHKGSSVTPIFYLSFPTPPFVATQTEAIQEVAKRAKQLRVKLIMLDNLGTISGGRDENSSEMIAVMNNLRWLAQETGAAVIVVHHDPKHENGMRKTPRGHSSIEAAVDLALWIKREDEVITLTATKTRGARFEPFSALWSWEHVRGTLTLREARFFGIGIQRDSKVIKAEQIILDYLKVNKQANQQELVQECLSKTKGANKIGRPTVISVLAQMVKNKKLKEAQGSRHTTLYSL